MLNTLYFLGSPKHFDFKLILRTITQAINSKLLSAITTLFDENLSQLSSPKSCSNNSNKFLKAEATSFPSLLYDF